MLSRRARRDMSDDSELNWAASWIYASNGLTISPSSDFTFPSTSGHAALEEEPPCSPPRKTLLSYSSADSLLRRTIKRASPRKPRPIPSRSDSSSLTGRLRPRSPLADFPDYDDERHDPGPSMLLEQPHPQVAYSLRKPSSESGDSSRNMSLPSTRMSVPMAMAMTTITSTVSVGTEVMADKKGRGKARQKDKLGPRQTRRRSSTVQEVTPAATPKSSPVEHPQALGLQRQLPRVRANAAGPSASPSRDHSEKDDPKSGRLTLSMSFAQVAALGTLTASSGRLPHSPASESSFESPRFARPEDSD